MAQLFASRHSNYVKAVVAVATPLMDPPARLEQPVAILYIHGDEDEQFSGFEVHSPHFATTPHGNWVTWGCLNGCHKQTATKTDRGVQFVWHGCKHQVSVVADFIADLGHEWPGSLESTWNQKYRSQAPLSITNLAWRFFAAIRP